MDRKAENSIVKFPIGIEINSLLKNTRNFVGNSTSARDDSYRNFLLAILQSYWLEGSQIFYLRDNRHKNCFQNNYWNFPIPQ